MFICCFPGHVSILPLNIFQKFVKGSLKSLIRHWRLPLSALFWSSRAPTRSRWTRGLFPCSTFVPWLRCCLPLEFPYCLLPLAPARIADCSTLCSPYLRHGTLDAHVYCFMRLLGLSSKLCLPEITDQAFLTFTLPEPDMGPEVQ